jgi:WD40 repeat protein
VIDRTVRPGDPATGQPLTTLQGHTSPVNGVCTIRAGGRDLLATASNDRTVRLWDPATGRQTLLIPVPHRVTALADLGEGALAVGLAPGLMVISLSPPSLTAPAEVAAMSSGPSPGRARQPCDDQCRPTATTNTHVSDTRLWKAAG